MKIWKYIHYPLGVILGVALTIMISGCDVNQYGYHEVRINGLIKPGDAGKYLEMLSKDRDYQINIESFGGSAFDMIAIINRIDELKYEGYRIRTKTLGFGLSAGLAIFLTGDDRIAHEDAVFMSHCAGMSGPFGRKSMKNPDGLTSTQKTKSILLDDVIIREMRSIGLDEATINLLLYDEDSFFFSAEAAMRIGIVTEFIK